MRNRAVAFDPGLVQLRMGLRAVTGVSTTLAVEWAFARWLGGPAQIFLTLGGILALNVSTAVSERTNRAAALTILGVPVPVLLGLGASVLLGGSRLATMAGLLGLLALSVWARRFGPRFIAYGLIAWMNFLFGGLLHLHWGATAHVVAAVCISTGWNLLLSVTLFRVHNARMLDRMLRAFGLRARAVSEAALEALRATAERAFTEADRNRVQRRVMQLNESALVIDGHLAAPGAVMSPRIASAVREALFDAEMAEANLASGLLRLLERRQEIPGEEMAGVEACVAALVREDLVAARTEAARIIDRLNGRGFRHGPHPDSLVYRVASAAQEFIAAAVRCVPQTPLDTSSKLETFSPAVELAAGGLPGSAPTVRAFLAESRISLSARQGVQVVLGAALAMVGGSLLSQDRYYWAVIVTVLCFSGTFTAAESIAKAFDRVLGTFLGVVLASPVAWALSGHPRLAVVAILASIFAAFYLMRVSYAVTMFFLTLMFGALYGLSGHFDSRVMVLRLEETLVGGVAGCLVALLVLPTSARDAAGVASMLLREALVRTLTRVGERLRGAGDSTFRDDARQLDAKLHQLRQVMRPLMRPSFLPRSVRMRERLRRHGAAVFHARRLSHDVERGAGVLDEPLRLNLADGCAKLVALATSHTAEEVEARRAESLVFFRSAAEQLTHRQGEVVAQGHLLLEHLARLGERLEALTHAERPAA